MFIKSSHYLRGCVPICHYDYVEVLFYFGFKTPCKVFFFLLTTLLFTPPAGGQLFFSLFAFFLAIIQGVMYTCGWGKTLVPIYN